MNARTALSRLLPLALLVGSAAAQTVPELIGVTAATPLLRTRDEGLCTERSCPPALFPPMSSHPASGGTAYDPIRGGAWITNGTHLACVDPDGCRYLCPIAPLSLSSRAFASGLALDERSRRLVVTDTANFIHIYDLRCPLGAPTLSCPVSVPAGHTIGGVATADVDGYVIYASSDFSGTAPPGSLLYVAPMSRPCSPICTAPIPQCSRVDMGPIHGVAYDQCTRTVWVTDGFKTLGMTLDLGTCRLTPTHCCLGASAEPFIGLCIVPSRGTVSGRSCVARACGPCTSMTIGTIGDPSIGNSSFAVTLDGAPSGSGAWLLLSFGGPCLSPGAPPPPPFCGTLDVTLGLLIVLGPVPTGGLIGCSGTAVMAVPVPPTLSLCGIHGCAQWLGVCPTGGTFTSNSLSFALSGS